MNMQAIIQARQGVTAPVKQEQSIKNTSKVKQERKSVTTHAQSDKNHNPVTGIVYSGRNAQELEATRQSNGWQSTSWITFKQAQSINRQVIKGSKSTPIFNGYHYKTTDKDDDKRVPIWSRVFNLDQTQEVSDAN